MDVDSVIFETKRVLSLMSALGVQIDLKELANYNQQLLDIGKEKLELFHTQKRTIPLPPISLPFQAVIPNFTIIKDALPTDTIYYLPIMIELNDSNLIYHKRVAEVALSDINSYIRSIGAGYFVYPLYYDLNQMSVPEAMSALSASTHPVIGYIVGCNTSAQVSQLAPISEDFIIISTEATSVALDEVENVFSMVSNDAVQSKVIQQELTQAGIESVVYLARNDAYGNSLVSQIDTVGGYFYNPDIDQADQTTIINTFEIIFNEHVIPIIEQETNAGRKVGFYVVSFEEIEFIVRVAMSMDIMGAVQWFGSDGNAEAVSLQQPELAPFVDKVSFIRPVATSPLPYFVPIIEESKEQPITIDAELYRNYQEHFSGLFAAVQKVTARNTVLFDARILNDTPLKSLDRLPAASYCLYDAIKIAIFAHINQGDRSRVEALISESRLYIGLTGWLNFGLNRRPQDEFYSLIKTVDLVNQCTSVMHIIPSRNLILSSVSNDQI